MNAQREPENLPVPCPAEELAPLIERLRSPEPVGRASVFPRGTILPDGRLDLCKQALGPDNAGRVTDALGDNAFVRSVLMGADFIGDAGAEHVAQLLARNATVETVFLGCNGITERGVDALCEAIEQRGGVRSLWLKRNPLGSGGGARIARLLASNCGLKTLDLAQTSIPTDTIAEVVRALADHNRELERLYLCGIALDAEACEGVARLLESACPIRHLYLSGNPIGDAGVRHIAGALPRAHRLRTLGLASTALSSDGGAALASAVCELPQLSRVELGVAPVGELHGVPRNRLGDLGAEAWAEAVERGAPIEWLALGGNGVSGRGALAFIRALEREATKLAVLELGRTVPRPFRHRVRELLGGRARPIPPRELVEIASVYRTARTGPRDLASPTPRRAARSRADSDPSSPESARGVEDIGEVELDAALRVLRKLARAPEALIDAPGRFGPLRAEASRLVAGVIAETRRRKASRRADRGRRATRPIAEPPLPAEPMSARRPVLLSPMPALSASERPRRKGTCYICHRPIGSPHARYEQLCVRCGSENQSRREERANLREHSFLVTGARIKIGYEVALRLLRQGASVIGTTRFPALAAERYAREADFDEFRGRLSLIGVDLRDLRAVQRLTRVLGDELDRLEGLVNNAACTIRRPPEYYAPLVERERAALASGGAACIRSGEALGLHAHRNAAELSLLQHGGAPTLSQGTLTLPGTLGADGEPLDLRDHNSWREELATLSVEELVEVHAVNAFAPALLAQGLTPLLVRAVGRVTAYAHIVNVSAMEGSFSRAYKSEFHPHTNMAKAGLNMLTRTVAESMAARGVLVNSVDTGWITDEQPAPLRTWRARELGFSPPLDAIDGAARVCAPIFATARGEPPTFGQFLKDYRPVPF